MTLLDVLIVVVLLLWLFGMIATPTVAGPLVHLLVVVLVVLVLVRVLRHL